MKILFVSLGCDKNLVDSEKMLGLLKQAGHSFTEDENEAEVCIVNTCCFIHDAKKESIDALIYYGEFKQSACLKYLIATGCLAQRYKNDILTEIPEVDACIAALAWDRIALAIEKLEKDGAGHITDENLEDAPKQAESLRIRSDINHYSYLKIAEGCDKHCTYCVIPSIRGGYHSEPAEQLVREAKELAESGVNELILVAQETTLYGTDIYGKKELPNLIRKLCATEGLEWIRLMYCYPEEIGEDLIDVFNSEPKLCKYIDMPIQHISDNILKRMGRRTNGNEIRSIIDRLRENVPGMVIRTSLITGFPGETEEEHKELVDFVREYRLDRVGVFTYSKEEGTPAARMKGQIKKAEKERRRKELMLAQQKVVFEKNKAMIGKRVSVIIDGKIADREVYIGRTYMDAPDVDASVFVSAGREIISGSIIDAVIEDFEDYDLIGSEFRG